MLLRVYNSRQHFNPGAQMATLEQEVVERAALQQVLSRLSRMAGPELARSDAGAGINFEAGVVFFTRILRLFHDLEGVALEDIPYSKLIVLTQMATSAADLLQEAKDLRTGRISGEAEAERDSILQRARDEYEGMFEAIAPILAFSVRERVETKVNLALFEARQTLTKARNLAQSGDTPSQVEGYRDDITWLHSALFFAFLTVLIGVGLLLKFFDVV